MNLNKVSEIVRCLRYDGYTLEEGARYCRQIALNARYSPYSPVDDAENYSEAASRLEAHANLEKLRLDYVTDLEQQNEHLLKRVLELEITIVQLTQRN